MTDVCYLNADHYTFLAPIVQSSDAQPSGPAGQASGTGPVHSINPWAPSAVLAWAHAPYLTMCQIWPHASAQHHAQPNLTY